MSEIANIEHSIQHRIFQILRQRKWFYEKKNVALTKIPGATGVYWAGKDQEWVFLDVEGKNPHPCICVKVNGVPQPQSTFKVNHRKGTITFSNTPSGTVTADLVINMCKVHKGYMDEETLEKSELPVVAWTIETTDGKPFALGTSSQTRTRFCSIEIAGRNHDEARDICEDLYRFIVWLPMLNMQDHQPLDFEGELDPAFVYDDQWVNTPTGKELLRMDIKPRATMLPPRVGGTDKEKHRALINFEVTRVS